MSTLDDLFAADRRAVRPSREADEPGASTTLAHLVGTRRRTEPPLRANADTSRLVSLVDMAAATASTDAAPPVLSTGKRRSRGRPAVDWINASAAALAAVIVIGTLGFAGVKAASASPATVVAASLAEDEEALASAERGLQSMSERLAGDISAGLEDGSAAQTAIEELDASVVDEAARAVVISAIEQHAGVLQTITEPQVPSAYERPDLDLDSLPAVAAAIDDVRAHADAVDEVVVQIRALRSSIEGARATLTQALSVFGATFLTHSASEAEENDAASQESRDAVLAAAAVVASVPLDGAVGRQAMQDYQAAVLALRDEDRRVRDEERESEQQSQTPGTGSTGGTGQQSPDPGTGTTPPEGGVPPDDDTDPAQP